MMVIQQDINHPYVRANFFAKYFSFWWLHPLFKIIKNRQLQQSDLFPVLHAEKCRRLLDLYIKNWPRSKSKSQQQTKPPSLIRCLFKCFGWKYLCLGIIIFINVAFSVIQPLFVGWLVSYFAPNSQMAASEAYVYAFGLSMISLLKAMTKQWCYFMTYRMGIRTGVLLSAAVFQKALKLNSTAMTKTTIGHIVNLLANDVLQMKEALQFLHFLWIGPLLVIVLTVLLWQQVGVACLAGVGVLILLVVQQSAFLSLLMKFRHRYLTAADERIRIMNEIIASMRTIKMYAWEIPFANVIKTIRKKETHAILSGYTFFAFSQSSYLMLNTMTCFITITVYVLLGHSIDAAKVFTVYALLNSMQVGLSIGVPQAFRAIADAKIWLRRIEAHLLLDELDENKGYRRLLTASNWGHVSVKNLTATWSSDFALNKISFTVPKGKLYTIVGPVGSGKTSMLLALLGELPLTSGSAIVEGKIGYVPQQPWVFSATVKENILFGCDFDELKYVKVIEACALSKDLRQLPHGDMTYVGERGVRLSGGQKARISLARAVYSDADIYLLDDPLSAVDIQVAHHLYDKCINGLLSDRIRILVTHQIQLLDKADKILVIENGRLMHSGPLDELANQGIDFAALLRSDNEKTADSDDNKEKLRSDSTVSESIKETIKVDKEDAALTEEEREEGKISYRTYFKFLTSGNGILFSLFILLLSIVGQGSIITTDWWLSKWSDNFISPIFNQSGENLTLLKRTSSFGLTNEITMGIYAGLVITSWSLLAIRCVLIAKMVIDSSRSFHNRMLKSILGAPIYFFDTKPVGRVLNRFAKDMNQLDDELTYTTMDVVQMGIFCCGLVVATIIFNPWALIPAVAVFIIFIIIRSFYVNVSREVTRLEAVACSPIYSHISSTLHGLSTIRAYKMEKLFLERFIDCQDNHTKPAVTLCALIRWNSFHIDCVSALYLTSVAFISIFAANGSLEIQFINCKSVDQPNDCVALIEIIEVSAGSIGLSLTYSILLLGNSHWLVKQSAELENQMTSVERVKEYAELCQEETNIDSSLPSNWPEYGKISFENMSFRHHENLPFVLHNINCCINAGEKIGVVGRTGAGKSSLVASLFRMSEMAGNIKIDEVSTSIIKLDRLRSKISVIPQDPSLFVGTLRTNLDPFHQYDDIKLWNALKEVQLSSYISSLSGQLDAEVSESGSNFSVGQKQLLCLARALLKNNKILVIDEATANVDFSTDEIIQKSIRSNFRHCTVITIAHRLNTIIDCDRIMLFSDGKLIEFDSPHTLLRNEKSEFAAMVAKTGSTEHNRMIAIAEKAYENKISKYSINSQISSHTEDYDLQFEISSDKKDEFGYNATVLESTV